MYYIFKIKLCFVIFFYLGQRLCRLDSTHTLGKGTYKRQDYIYSSLAGIVNVDDSNKVNTHVICIINYYFN